MSPVAGHPSEASSFCDRTITAPTEAPETLLRVICVVPKEYPAVQFTDVIEELVVQIFTAPWNDPI